MNFPEWIKEAEILYKQNISFTQIGKILKVDRKKVSYYLQKKGYKPNHKYMSKTKVIEKTKKEIDENIFEKIDTEEKAYWLGFLYADGCVSEIRNSVELSLQEQDYEHLIKYKNFLKSKHEIKKRIKDNKYVSYRLSFNSKKIKEDLIKVGCIPRKSLILTFPTEEQVSKELIPHFIRGYLDGDGCITHNSKGNVSVEILGTNNILKGITNYFNIENHIYTFNHSSVKRFIIAGDKAKSILNCLYENATIYLDRKYNKYLKFCRFELNTTENSK